MKSNSGFGWCPLTGWPTAPQDVWDAYLLAHPKAKEFQQKALPLFNELHDIFSGVVATGRFAASSDSVADAEYHQQHHHEHHQHASDSDGERESNGSEHGESDSSTSAAQQDSPRTPRRGRIAQQAHTPQAPQTPQARPVPRTPSSVQSKRRRTSGDRISGALEKLAKNHERRTEQKAEKRTQTQIAIKTFIEEYGSTLTAEQKLGCVQHFMNNPAAAEAYNVLDSETKEAFVLSVLGN